MEGVGGPKCDRCSHGYYGFQGSGCKGKSAENIIWYNRWLVLTFPSLTGCDVLLSQHAPVNTLVETATLRMESASAPPTRRETAVTGVRQVTGVTTQTQAARYTQTHIQILTYIQREDDYRCDIHYLHSLQPCSCSVAGSAAPQCDLSNGQCHCRSGFSGRSCDRCAPGYHGYPACSACQCDIAGTEEKFCNTTLGVCECQDTGKCECKVTCVNVSPKWPLVAGEGNYTASVHVTEHVLLDLI